MKLSTDRLLTTHVGSLPRPANLHEPLLAKDRGGQFDERALAGNVAEAVDDIVARQVAVGIDVACDGEVSKTSYTHYVRHRLAGIEATDELPEGLGQTAAAGPADMMEHTDFAQQRRRERGPAPVENIPRILCTSPVRHHDISVVERDIANLKAAAARHKPADLFMNAASPGVLTVFIPDVHYQNNEAYLADLADAMRVEYEAITGAGITLQIDCPDLAMARHMTDQALSEAEFLKRVEQRVEAINHATAAIPPENMRMHLCWGNYPGPHTHDIAVATLLPIIAKARPQAISFEGANPRHAHEWEDWKAAKLPDDKVLLPGVIDSGTNYVEHPRLIAQRIMRYTDIVGRERVIAAADCGFGTFIGRDDVAESIAWKKFEELAAGAQIASEQLWSH